MCLDVISAGGRVLSSRVIKGQRFSVMTIGAEVVVK